MAKGSSIWTDQLVSLLGLDSETVKTQIIPFLDSFDDEPSLRSHLTGLVGTDTPLAKNFVRDFTRSRFPHAAAASGSTTPTTAAAPAASNAGKKRGKKTLAERAGIGQKLQPRRVEENEEEQMARLSEAFGGMGTVYRKKQDEEEFFVGMGKGKKPARQATRSGHASGTSTPTEPPQPHHTEPVETHHFEPVHAPATTTEEAASKPSPPPTAEMLAIDAVVSELASTIPSSTSAPRKLCFCQGRKHPLAPYSPLCYSCGLILCSSISPSPLSPLSSCPSCSSSPLLSAAARADLISKFTAEREILFEQQLLQIQLQREEKKLSKASAREEVALFPQLGVSGSGGVTGGVMQGPVMGKHGALQKAKAIAGEAGRTAKVLSLDMKTHKVKSHTKVTRPKAPVLKAQGEEKGEEEEEVEQDPFVGLNGEQLVRNDADDGMRKEAGSRLGMGNGSKSKAARTIPQRSWAFGDGSELVLRPAAPVK